MKFFNIFTSNKKNALPDYDFIVAPPPRAVLYHGTLSDQFAENFMFSCYGNPRTLEISNEAYFKMNKDGYLFQLRDRLESHDIIINTYIRNSQSYNEIVNGERFRIVIEAYRLNISKLDSQKIDKDEIELYFDDIKDDFPELELNLYWHDIDRCNRCNDRQLWTHDYNEPTFR